MSEREEWHSRLISEFSARLKYLAGLADIETSKQAQRGADIRVQSKATRRTINIEIQQFDSGAGWKATTIPSWIARHDLATIIVFTEPTIERVRNKFSEIPEYEFFQRENVFLFSDTQLHELVAFVGSLVLQEKNKTPENGSQLTGVPRRVSKN
jgi:hypothetical protein